MMPGVPSVVRRHLLVAFFVLAFATPWGLLPVESVSPEGCIDAFGGFAR